MDGLVGLNDRYWHGEIVYYKEVSDYKIVFSSRHLSRFIAQEIMNIIIDKTFFLLQDYLSY